MRVVRRALKHALLPRELTKKQKNHYKKLHEKFAARHRSSQERLWQKHNDALQWVGKNFSSHNVKAGSIGSLMLLAPVSAASISATPTELPKIERTEKIEGASRKALFFMALKEKVPTDVRPLLHDEEEELAALISEQFGVRVTPELDGKRLNRSYGYIGAEQHLARYPGDTMATHFDTQEEANRYYSSGMAPGLGAWGHFAASKAAFTAVDKEREKYYIAVQTFMAPGYNEHVHEYYQFFKFRKMMLVNPDNGKAIVVVIGDAGPAVWTGKSLGGSPEVMNYLERVDGRAKGPVLYFFVDDPADTVPLGPVSAPEDV